MSFSASPQGIESAADVPSSLPLPSSFASPSPHRNSTKMSTFSYVAARRVEAWNDGVTTIVG